MTNPQPTPEFRWTSLGEARDLGLDDLLALNWEEVEHHKDVSPFDPNWPAYRDLERRGQLQIAIMTLAGKLIGYNVFFVTPPLHHKSTVWAVNDMVYLLPEHRRGAAGIKLIAQAEKGLKAMGVRVILYGSKPDLSDGDGRDSVAGRLLCQLGYEPFDRSWSKAL